MTFIEWGLMKSKTHKFTIAILIFSLTFILYLHSILGFAQSTIGTVDIEATSDAYVLSDFWERTNFGSGEVLIVGNDLLEPLLPAKKALIYLKFDLSEIKDSDAVINASLILRAMLVSNENSLCVHFSNESEWDEWSISWSNSPNFNSTPISCIKVSLSGKEYMWNVTETVLPLLKRQSSKVTFVIESLNKGEVHFDSRETPYGPKLRLYLESKRQNSTTALFYLSGAAVTMMILVLYLYSKRSHSSSFFRR